jgi:hypothetical protein
LTLEVETLSTPPKTAVDTIIVSEPMSIGASENRQVDQEEKQHVLESDIDSKRTSDALSNIIESSMHISINKNSSYYLFCHFTSRSETHK